MSNSESHPDVVVVGAGPSGSITAITIAQKGHKVVLLDKKEKKDIGDKTCGDAIDLAALERLKEGTGLAYPQGSEISDPIKKMSIAVNDVDNKISLDAPGVQVDRHIYGQRLLSAALKLGVTLIDKARVTDVITETIDGEIFLQGVRYNKDGAEHEIRGKITVDASGAYAGVRKKLPEALIKGGIKHELDADEVWPTYREIIELKDEDHRWHNEILLMYHNDYPSPGYFWIFTKGAKKLNVGIGWAKYQELGSMKDMYLKEMEKYYPQDAYTIIKKGGGQIPFRIPFDTLVFNGGGLVGDAGCMVHPITAEGHGPALNSGMLLGQTIHEALEKGDFSRKSLWGFNQSIASHYGRKHADALIMQRLINNLGADGLDFLFKKQIFREEELNLVFSGGSLELSLMDKLKRVLKVITRPKILLQIKRIFDQIDMCRDIYAKYPSNPDDLQQWRERRNELLDMNF